MSEMTAAVAWCGVPGRSCFSRVRRWRCSYSPGSIFDRVTGYGLGEVVLVRNSSRNGGYRGWCRLHGIGGNLRHSSSQLGQLSHVIQGSESIQLFQSQNQGFVGRRIEKVEMNEIIDAETLEHEDNIAEVDSLNLRDGILLQFVLVEKNI